MINPYAKKIVEAWNTYAIKKQVLDAVFEIRIQPRVVGRIIELGESVSAVKASVDSLEAGTEELLEAMRNHYKALQLDNSKAWGKWNLFQFVNHGYCNYLPGIFNLDNYDKTNFEEGGNSGQDIMFDFD